MGSNNEYERQEFWNHNSWIKNQEEYCLLRCQQELESIINGSYFKDQIRQLFDDDLIFGTSYVYVDKDGITRIDPRSNKAFEIYKNIEDGK